MKPLTRILLSAILLAIAAAPLRAEDPLPGMPAQPSTYFYTGKPYDEDLEAYAFVYRTLSPSISRWTSTDPSGFLDGANNSAYKAIPTSQLDFAGLLTIAGTINPNPESEELTYNGRTFKVTLWTATHIASPNLLNFSGWTLNAGGARDGALTINPYAPVATSSSGFLTSAQVGADFTVTASGLAAPDHQYDWIQRINTNVPLGGRPNSYFDIAAGQTDPFYPGTKGVTGASPWFGDRPSRDNQFLDMLIDGSLSRIDWGGALYLSDRNNATNTATVYDGIQWGWTVKMLE